MPAGWLSILPAPAGQEVGPYAGPTAAPVCAGTGGQVQDARHVGGGRPWRSLSLMIPWHSGSAWPCSMEPQRWHPLYLS